MITHITEILLKKMLSSNPSTHSSIHYYTLYKTHGAFIRRYMYVVFQRKGDKVFIVKLLIGNTETIMFMVIPVNVLCK